jgi:flagellar biosynthesis activator protein FlaF
MNSTQSQISAYTGNQKEGASPRQIEAYALLSCAAKLKQAQEAETDYELFCEIVRHNQRLWTIFQVSLVEDENPLPQDLKITLLNLARFVDKVSMRALAEHEPKLLNSLIDINRNIAAGLNAQNEATAAAVPQPVAEMTNVSAFSA